MKLASCLLVLIFFTFTSADLVDNSTLKNSTSPKINTTLGLIVRGSQIEVSVKQPSSNSTKNVTIDLYYGIPFAEPPLGKLRLQPPQPKSAWNSSQVLVAKDMPAGCIQEQFGILGSINSPVSEDCLYLNMYVPNVGAKKRAVMVFIHGGGFYSGNIVMYPGEYLAANEDIIVVIIQYRLGILGFLSTDDKVMKGNYGMWDQQLALKWIKENVVNFGGDPDRITIFGESVGAQSVSLHLLNVQSQKYFKRAIMQSGSALSAVLKDTNYIRKLALEFVKENLTCVECGATDYKCMLECVQNLNASEILKQQTMILNENHALSLPIVDGEFIKSFPSDMPADKFGSSDTDMLLGVTENEGGMFLYSTLLSKNLSITNPPIATSQMLVNTSFANWPQLPAVASQHVVKAVVLHSTPWSDPNDNLLTARMTGKVLGRSHFVSDANKLADWYVKNKANVYYYVFDHQASVSFAGYKYPPWVGSTHGDDLLFTNGLVFQRNKYTTVEYELSRRMMKLWANFARSGNANSTQDSWKKMTSSKKEYLLISTNSSKQMTGGFERQECAFLEKILPVIAAASRPSTTTQSPEKPEKSTPAAPTCVTNTRAWIITVAVIGSVAVILFFALLGTCVNCQRQNGRGSAYIT